MTLAALSAPEGQDRCARHEDGHQRDQDHRHRHAFALGRRRAVEDAGVIGPKLLQLEAPLGRGGALVVAEHAVVDERQDEVRLTLRPLTRSQKRIAAETTVGRIGSQTSARAARFIQSSRAPSSVG